MLKEVQMWTVVCDRCGKDAFEEGEFSAYTESHHALDIALDSDWSEYNGRHYCPDCGAPLCQCGHLYVEHDYGTEPCESCDCKEFVATV